MKAPGLKGPVMGVSSPPSTNTGKQYSQPRLKTIKRLLTKPQGSGGQMRIKPFGA